MTVMSFETTSFAVVKGIFFVVVVVVVVVVVGVVMGSSIDFLPPTFKLKVHKTNTDREGDKTTTSNNTLCPIPTTSTTPNYYNTCATLHPNITNATTCQPFCVFNIKWQKKI